MERVLLAWVAWVLEWRRTVLGLMLVATVVAGWQASRLQVNSSPYVVDVSHPVRQAQAYAGTRFSAMGEQALVVLESPGGNVFTADTVHRVAALTRAFEQLSLGVGDDEGWVRSLCQSPGYDSICTSGLANGLGADDRTWLPLLSARLAQDGRPDDVARLDDLRLRLFPVIKVRSLTTVEDLYAENQDMFMAEPLVANVDASADELAALKQRALDNPLYRGLLLAPDARATSIQVELAITGDDTINMRKAYAAIEAAIAQHPGPEAVYLGGVPVINTEIARVMDEDNRTFLPLVIVMICLMLYLSFRRWQGLVLPLAVAVITLVWTLGIMAALGIRQNVVTTMLPIFIMAISVSDAIHYLSNYYGALAGRTADKAVMSAFRDLALPLFMTSVTTMIGFLSLAWTDIVSVREFGLLVALGVLLAFVVTLLLFPAVLPAWRAAAVPVRESRPSSAGLVAVRQPRRVLATAGALLVLMLAGMLALQVDNHSSAGFSEDSRFRQDDAAINRLLGGTFPVNLLLTSSEDDLLSSPETLQAIEHIQARLATHASVGYSVSPADFLKRIHQVLRSEPAALPQPLTRDIVAQYYFLYENSNGQDLRTVLDETGRHARIAVLFHTDRASEFRRVIDDVTTYAATVLPAGVKMQATGYGAEIVVATDAVVVGQVTSIALSIVLIGLVMIVLYRSLWLGLLALVPLVFTLVANFALMAATGTVLDIGTALIAGITFGIGIDYAIHFLSALRRHLSLLGGTREVLMTALQQALSEMTRPVLINSVALAGGFILLALSGFAPIRQTGYFVALTMILASASVLLILPALVAVFKPSALFVNESAGPASLETSLENN